MENPSPFTFVGRLVILLAIVIAIGGTAADFWWFHESLEGSHLLLEFAILPFLAAICFVLLSVWILWLFGLRFFNDQNHD